MGTMAVDNENTTCMWMTATTVGYIGLMVKNTDGDSIPPNVTPATMGPVLLKVRDAIEHQQG
jgi:hypothetical protein